MADIKTSSALVRFLERVAEESVQEAMPPVYESERHQQAKKDKDLAGLRASDENKRDEVDEEEDASKDADAEKKPRKKLAIKKDLTKLGSADKVAKDVEIPTSKEVLGAGLRDVIDQLNMIRSGSSLKDEKVRKNLDAYMAGLSAGERQSLFVFLSGISQIVSSGVSGAESPSPGEVGITMKGKEPKTGSKKAKSPAEKAKVPLGDEDNEDVPIVVGEAANKGNILRRARRLMRGA